MKDTERLRLLYQNDGAFGVGVIVGKQEAIDKAIKWMEDNLSVCKGSEAPYILEKFRKAMEE